MRTLMIGFLLSVFVLSACTPSSSPDVTQPVQVELPTKRAEAVSLTDSPINPSNLDDFLFRKDVFYVDVRTSNQFIDEGHVAGFINIPYYGLIVQSGADAFGLFKMTRQVDASGNVLAAYGEPGSFVPLYQESESILRFMFPSTKVLFVLSTAGVEAQYLINLLRQYDYDGTRLYNVGNFSNSLGSLTAYRLRSDALYLVSGHAAFQVEIRYDFGPLTPLDE